MQWRLGSLFERRLSGGGIAPSSTLYKQDYGRISGFSRPPRSDVPFGQGSFDEMEHHQCTEWRENVIVAHRRLIGKYAWKICALRALVCETKVHQSRFRLR